MRLRIALATAAFSLSLAAPAAAAPADDFRTLTDEHYRWLLAESPLCTRYVGDEAAASPPWFLPSLRPLRRHRPPPLRRLRPVRNAPRCSSVA